MAPITCICVTLSHTCHHRQEHIFQWRQDYSNYYPPETNRNATKKADHAASTTWLRLYCLKITQDKIKEVKRIKSNTNRNPCGVTSGTAYLAHISRNWLRSQQRVWNNDKWCHKLHSLSSLLFCPPSIASLGKAQLIHIGVTMRDCLPRYFIWIRRRALALWVGGGGGRNIVTETGGLRHRRQSSTKHVDYEYIHMWSLIYVNNVSKASMVE
jgi:hypothetical protein